jgi:hypothetical protein
MGREVTFKLRHYKSRLRLASGRTPGAAQSQLFSTSYRALAGAQIARLTGSRPAPIVTSPKAMFHS